MLQGIGKKLVLLLGMGLMVQFGGCLSSGLARDVIIDQALDLLTGNNTVLDLIAI
ncbi:MAG: hypothetical protein HJJLKODD_00224 [Phycisphaerae bacterium]|nr:hypothetical protein [Phycisphaerae bacterium]